MASNNSSATGTVFLDTTSAQAALDRLNNKIKAYDDELTKANTSAARRLTIERDRAAAAEKAANIQLQIEKGLGATYNQQAALVKSLASQIKNLAVGSQEYADKLKELRKAEAVFDEMKAKIKGVDDAQKNILTKVGVFFAAFAANMATNVLGSIQDTVASVFDLRVQLEKSVKNLSAITGATGNDLEFLKNAAIELSKTSSQSAVDFVEGFKLIASAKPELLSAKEDLVAVTKQALLLSQASGLELPDAATKLTDALNQFGEPAQSAAKYVDALAAAAKFGAAEVPEVTDALLKFGSLAKSSNINIYESAAAIELLAEKGLKGAEAGTQLRNVFLRLSAVQSLPKSALDALEKAGVNTAILQDKSLSLEQRLKELSKVQNDTNAMVKIFGTENLNAGQIVLQNIPRYAELAKQVRETGVASEQAATNTDTLANKWQEFKNLLSSLFLEGSNSPLKKGVEVLTLAVKGLQVVITTVVTSLQNAYSAAKLAAGVVKDLATLSPVKAYNRVKDAVNGFDDGEKQKEDERKRAEAQIAATSMVNEAAKSSLAEQKRMLQQNIELQNASFKAYNDMVTSGKKNTAEGKRITEQLYRDTQIVNGLRKLVKDGEASAAQAGTSNAGAGDLGNPAAEKKAAAAAKKDAAAREALLKQLKDFQFELQQVGKQADESEIARITKKYDELIVKAAKYGFDYIELEKAKNSAIAFLLEDEKKKRDEALRKINQAASEETYVNFQASVNDAADQQKDAETKRYASGLINKRQLEEAIRRIDLETYDFEVAIAENFSTVSKQAATDLVKFKKGKSKEEIADAIAKREHLDALEKRSAVAGAQVEVLKTPDGTKARLDAQLNLLKVERDNELKNTDLTNKEKELINEQYRQQAGQLTVKFYTDQVQQVLSFISTGISIISQLNDARSAKEKAALDKELKNNDARKASIKKLEDSKVITSQEAQRRIAAIDAEAEKKKEELDRKQFERSKKIQIAQALVNGAMGITSTLAAIPGPLDILSLGTMRAIQLGLVIATTAAQVAAIASAKFAEGGRVDHPGNGKIRVASNIPAQANGDDVLATVKRGEVILNEEQQRRLGGPAIFRSIGVPGFAGGGVIKPFWQTRPYRSIDYGRVTKSIQILKYAEGGKVPAQQGNGQPVTGTQPDPAVLEALQQTNAVNAALVETITSLSNQIASGISANISLKKIDDATARRNRIKGDSEMR